MLPLLACLALAPTFDFYTHGPYDAAIPRPEAILGYAAGERHTNFRDQERVLLGIAEKAPGRVKTIQYGKSVEGRPLRIFVIGSESNISRLDELQKQWQGLANAKASPQKDLPALVWINECIHGNEPASFESAMWLVYSLAAGKIPALDNAVVIVNPVYNPDGHERFAVWYNSISTGSAAGDAFEGFEPRVIHGRSNHYRFDMNRDRVAMSQDETRQEVAEFLKWNPQVYVDQHGEVGSYFFPPNPMSIHAAVDRERLNHWTDIFGRSNAAAFDRQGWNYFIKRDFDFFFAGYLDTWATLSGAIGMTYETSSGKRLNDERDDGSILTFRDGIAQHFTSAIATIEAAAAHRAKLLESFAKFRSEAASGLSAGKFKRVVVEGGHRQLLRLAEQLRLSGISSGISIRALEQDDAHGYWDGSFGKHAFSAGSLVIDMAQPQGALAKALLEPNAEFEKEFFEAQLAKVTSVSYEEEYPGRESPDFYDITGWSLVYAHNLRAWWCESSPQVQVAFPEVGPVPSKKESTVGWALRYEDQNDILAIFDLLASGVRCMATTKEMKVGAYAFAPGTFLVLKSRNDEDTVDKINDVERKRVVRFIPLGTGYPSSGSEGPGSESVVSLKKPSVAVVFGGSDWLSGCGGWWWLMECEFKLPFTPVSADALNNNLSKYTCIVFPSGRYQPPSENLKDWVRNGGCAVVVDSLGWALGEKGFAKLDEVKQEKGEPKGLPGTLFRAKVDPRMPLAYGYSGSEIAVPIEGTTFYKARKEGGGVVTLSGGEKEVKLLSGWAWPDDSERNLRGTVWLHDEPYGRGHAVFFTQDPAGRAMWPGLHKLALNGLLLGK